ncbi:hypothetical protein EBL87_20530 [Cereibacter sphaeroides]|nr:hypothetical protein EBL87_20530 [Cereibacter sphaeroides]
MSAGPVGDHTAAADLLEGLPKAHWLPVDRGCNADRLRDALKDTGMKASIPDRKTRKKPERCDNRRRSRIEIVLGRLTGWRRVATDTTGAPRQSSPRSPRYNRHVLALTIDESGA